MLQPIAHKWKIIKSVYEQPCITDSNGVGLLQSLFHRCFDQIFIKKNTDHIKCDQITHESAGLRREWAQWGGAKHHFAKLPQIKAHPNDDEPRWGRVHLELEESEGCSHPMPEEGQYPRFCEQIL